MILTLKYTNLNLEVDERVRERFHRTVSADGYLFQIGLWRTKVDVFHRNNQITKRGFYPEVKIISK